MNLAVFVVRLAIALILGAIIGLEQSWRHRKACTRTNALVPGGASAFVMAHFSSRAIPPPRPGSCLMSYRGVVFLGAGVISKEGANVRALNTAATIWCSDAVETLSGMGYPQYSAATAVAVLLVNITLRPLPHKLRPELDAWETDYHLELVYAPTTRDTCGPYYYCIPWVEAG